jgi:hypothetical protein
MPICLTTARAQRDAHARLIELTGRIHELSYGAPEAAVREIADLYGELGQVIEAASTAPSV